MVTMDTVSALGTHGLTSAEARRLLGQWGENRVSPKRRVHPALMLLQKFISPLLLVLIGAALLSFFLGQRTNALIILFMVAVSGVLDFLNSYKSARAVEAAGGPRHVYIVIADGIRYKRRHAGHKII
jgi:Mg2+-importing ATPase